MELEELVAALGILGLALWCDGVLWWVVASRKGLRLGCGLAPVDAARDAGDLVVRTFLNGQVVQEAAARDELMFPLGLLVADRVELGVALAVHQGERLVVAGRDRLAVPDEQQLAGAGRPGEAELAVRADLGQLLVAPVHVAGRWVQHGVLTGRMKSQLRELRKTRASDDDALEALQLAIEYAKTQRWAKSARLTLANVGSNGKLVEYADAAAGLNAGATRVELGRVRVLGSYSGSVLASRGGWVNVRFADGRTSWLPQGDVETI